MHYISRKLFYTSLLLALMSLVIALPVLPVHAAGTLYSLPANQQVLAAGSTFTIKIQVASIDPFNAWDISVLTDNMVISPQSLDITGNVLAANFTTTVFPLINCINGAGTGCIATDGAGIAHSAVTGFGPPPQTGPSSGLLFTITYKVVGTGAFSLIHPFSDIIANGATGLAVAHTTVDGAYGSPSLPPSFKLSVLPDSGNLVQGSTTSTTVTATATSGTPGSVSFTTSTLPSGVKAAFSPTNCPATCSSTLTFSATNTAATGTVTVTIRGTATGIPSASTTYSLTVQQLQKDFSITVNPSSLTIVQGGSAQTSDIDLTGSNGFTDTIQLTPIVSGSGGPQALLSLNPVMLSSTTTSAVSTLSVSALATATLGTFTVTVNTTGIVTGKSHLSPPVFVTIVAPSASADFALVANPSTLFISPGNLGPSLITVRSLNGFAGTLVFTASIFPSGPTVSLSQKTVVLVARGSWTLVGWVFTTTATAPSSYTLTVTATSGSISHSVKITVTVL